MRFSAVIPFAAVVFPLAVAVGQGHSVSPYVRAGNGFGTLGFDDASVSTVEGGVTLLRRLSVGVEYMDLSGSSEFSRWTVATAELHVLSTSRRVSPWLAGGIGSATARMPDDENTTSNKRTYRFNGSGVHTALGVDIGIVAHVFVTPSLSIKQTKDNAESQVCSYDYVSGNSSCGAWSPYRRSFQTFEMRIAIGARY
jgi:hypothetical protein